MERQYYCSCAAASLDYQMSLHGGSTESELNKRRRSCVVFDGGLEDLPGVFTNLRAEQWYVFTIVRVRSVEFLHVQTAQAPSAGRDFVPLNPPGTTEYHPCCFLYMNWYLGTQQRKLVRLRFDLPQKTTLRTASAKLRRPRHAVCRTEHKGMSTNNH